MSLQKFPSSPETGTDQNAAIRKLSGTLFILAIIEDEDDAACLRADLNRSQLVNYKLQQCKTLDDGLSLAGSCNFDLVLLRLNRRKDLGIAAQQIRKLCFTTPVVALASNRILKEYAGNKPDEIDELIRLEDMNPSLLEQTIRGAVDRQEMAQVRDFLRERLEIALDTGKLGLWTYISEKRTLELDPIAATMFGFPQKPSIVHLDDTITNLYPEDRAKIQEVFDQLGMAPQEFKCDFRLNEDSMPLTRIELQGRFKEDPETGACLIVGVAREAEKANELYNRIVEANAEIHKAIKSREQALNVANKKLKSLADEFAMPLKKSASNPVAGGAEKAPSIKRHTLPTNAVAKKPASAVRQPSKETTPSVEELAKSSSSGAKANSKLSINKQSSYKKVLDSMTAPEVIDPKNQQEAFPFDFSRDPITDFSEPDPTKEGFIAAAQRVVAMTRRGHELDVSISIGNQDELEDDEERELLFSVLKELLTNVVRHAKASLCIISVFRDEDEWVLQVEDDGIGLEEKLKSVSSPLNQIGLFRIRTQLALKGGHLDMAPASPSGLVARARLPVNFSSKVQVSE